MARSVGKKKKSSSIKTELNSVQEDLVKAAAKSVDLTCQNIEKVHGKGAVMRLGQSAAVKQVDSISTGSVSLDLALGVGGYPRGRIVEIYGQEITGKTTLALHAIAGAQKTGGICAYIDAEHALDPDYASNLGVDTNNLLLAQPDFGEQALDIADQFVRSAGIAVVVIDSVAALTPKAELEGDIGDLHIGLQARLMSQAMRKLTGIVNKSRTLVIFINQIRQKIGVLFGNPNVTTGGLALKFYASVRLEIARIGSVKAAGANGAVIGNRTRVKVVKNKLAPPFRNTEFDIIYGKGISLAGDVLDLAIERGIIQKSGAWFSYRSDRIGQGRENTREYLENNPKFLAQLKDEILSK